MCLIRSKSERQERCNDHSIYPESDTEAVSSLRFGWGRCPCGIRAGGLGSGIQSKPGTARVWGTYAKGRHAAVDALVWQPLRQQAPDAIVLDPSTVKQEILGFGGAFTDAACYVIAKMPASQPKLLLLDLFSSDEMALSVCRTTLGASDYSRNAYTYDESSDPDPQLKKFSIDHDKAYILRMLREARLINPTLFLFSSPWSPPGWMKSSNTMFGGAMRSKYLEVYAEYFNRFLADYNAAGVEINAVTVQNEVDSEQEGRMPQVSVGPAVRDGVRKEISRALVRNAGLRTKIWVLDHNYDLWGRAVDELSDAATSDYIDGVAWHPYLGESSWMSLVHNLFPSKHAYYTEGGPDLNQSDYRTEWAKWGEIFNGVLNNWARSITSWNLALDEHGNPNIGPFRCGGLVTVENGSGNVVQSGQYWPWPIFPSISSVARRSSPPMELKLRQVEALCWERVRRRARR